MYFKNAVMVLLHDHFYDIFEASHYQATATHRSLGTREAVMELDEAKEWVSVYKNGAKKCAYKLWLNRYKSLYGCLTCRERRPDALLFHHLGEEFTGMRKTDRIANMVSKQQDLYEIEHEMSKCTVLCQNCHEIANKIGKRAFQYIYDKNEKHYGYKVRYGYGYVDGYGWYRRPGEDCEAAKSLRKQFMRDLNEIDIEIVGPINLEFLNKYNKKTQLEQEDIAESEYTENREKAMGVEIQRSVYAYAGRVNR